MSVPDKKWQVFEFLRAFFPLQLIIASFKYNMLALLFWLVLFLIVGDSLGYSFGIPLLFLSPEYHGEVSVGSFFLLGLAIGGFIMGFNTYSYMKLGPHFPFLTTLSKPFVKFCVNNALLPVAFILFMVVKVIQFQHYQELKSISSILLYIFSFGFGLFTFFAVSFFYFFRVAHKTEGNEEDDQVPKPIISVTYNKEKWFERFKRQKNRRSIYFGRRMRLIPSRSLKHFDQKLVEKVFAKNKINASVFEISTISLYFILGAFSNYYFFEVPAAMSIVLLLTIFLMLFSALYSWLKGWLYPILILVLLSMNYLSTRTGMFNYTSYAYGLDYSKQEVDEYSINRIREISNNDSLISNSYHDFVETLNNWKAQTNEEKPKLVIVNTSGGGSRSALWTMVVLQKSDEHLNGKLANHIQLITGASGGMIGAAYYRELLLRNRKGEIKSIYAKEYRDNIGGDLLNKLSFMASTNDIFIRYRKFQYNGMNYTKDRGHAFEEQLHKNTKGALMHNLQYYKKYERNGMIPTMIFSPTIINDGRRLLISSQHLNFLTENFGKPSIMTESLENIDYQSLLFNQSAGDIRFSSVLRANATFPFVMPMVTLPTKPEIQLMDAGIRDNYGGKTLMEFLYIMESWIKENTSGVVILRIRDTKKVLDNETYTQVSFMDKITLPFGNMYKNFPKVQDFNQDELIKIGVQRLEFPVDLITFNLKERMEERISLSWHLTKQEKIKIEHAFYNETNQNALNQLKRVL